MEWDQNWNGMGPVLGMGAAYLNVKLQREEWFDSGRLLGSMSVHC